MGICVVNQKIYLFHIVCVHINDIKEKEKCYLNSIFGLFFHLWDDKDVIMSSKCSFIPPMNSFFSVFHKYMLVFQGRSVVYMLMTLSNTYCDFYAPVKVNPPRQAMGFWWVSLTIQETCFLAILSDIILQGRDWEGILTNVLKNPVGLLWIHIDMCIMYKHSSLPLEFQSLISMLLLKMSDMSGKSFIFSYYNSKWTRDELLNL